MAGIFVFFALWTVRCAKCDGGSRGIGFICVKDNFFSLQYFWTLRMLRYDCSAMLLRTISTGVAPFARTVIVNIVANDVLIEIQLVYNMSRYSIVAVDSVRIRVWRCDASGLVLISKTRAI